VHHWPWPCAVWVSPTSVTLAVARDFPDSLHPSSPRFADGAARIPARNPPRMDGHARGRPRMARSQNHGHLTVRRNLKRQGGRHQSPRRKLTCAVRITGQSSQKGDCSPAWFRGNSGHNLAPHGLDHCPKTRSVCPTFKMALGHATTKRIVISKRSPLMPPSFFGLQSGCYRSQQSTVSSRLISIALRVYKLPSAMHHIGCPRLDQRRRPAVSPRA